MLADFGVAKTLSNINQVSIYVYIYVTNVSKTFFNIKQCQSTRYLSIYIYIYLIID
jgi:hypothetical protein